MVTIEKNPVISAHLRGLESLSQQHLRKYLTFDISCAALPDELRSETLDKHRNLQYVLRMLSKYDEYSTVYWFSINSRHSCSQVLEAMIAARMRAHKHFSYIPDTCAFTRCLYVGKTQRRMSLRAIAHFGLRRSCNTTALHLCTWAKELRLKVRLHVILLSPEARKDLELIEAEMAETMQPLIGGHKYREKEAGAI
jgi:hypothetical protein